MKIIAVFILLSVMTGCLKTDELVFNNNPEPLVLIQDSNWPAAVYEWSTPPSDSIFGTSQLTIRASVSSGKAFDHDIRVGFGIDLQALEEFNTAWSAGYALLPEECYSGALEVAIPAGSVDGYAYLTSYPEKMDGINNYLLPLTISTASDGLKIAGNRRLLLHTLQGF